MKIRISELRALIREELGRKKLQEAWPSQRSGWKDEAQLKFPSVWKDLMDSVNAAVESGEPRAEVMQWAHQEYDDYESQMSSMAASEAGEFDEPTFDVQGRL